MMAMTEAKFSGNSRYYLPALCFVTVIGFWLVHATVPGRWVATMAAAVHLVLVGLACLWMLVLDYDTLDPK